MKKIITLLLCSCLSSVALAESEFILDVKQTNAEKTILDEHTIPRVLILKTTPTLLAKFQNQKQQPNQHVAEQLNRATVED